jgi:hypothetical protein
MSTAVWRFPAQARLCGLLVLLLLASCAPGTVTTAPQGPSAQDVWTRFHQSSTSSGREQALDAFGVRASLNIATPERSSRVVFRFWGNLDGALRVDLEAGVGASLAMWREGEDGFLAYVPERRTAYTHADSRAAMAAFGLPLPLNMRELALVVTGRLDQWAPREYDKAVPGPEDGYAYRIRRAGQVYTLFLDRAGRPLELVQNPPGDAAAWRMAFLSLAPARELGADAASGRETLWVPRRMKLTRGADHTALLYVK